MALIVKDRVRETTTTTGTGTLTLIAPVTGFQSFSVIGDGNQTYYSIVDVATGAFEVGIGTYTASGTTLSRQTVLESSNANALVSFGSGTKDVFVTYPSDRSVSQADIGTAPNEIPLNQYLGNLAYQDAENIVSPIGVGTSAADWNVGVGYTGVDVGASQAFFAGGGGGGVVNNAVFKDGSWVYKVDGTVALYAQGAGGHTFFTAASGTAGGAVTLVPTLSLSSNGNLVQFVNTTAATLTANQTLTFSIVDDSTLRISVRGSDGTTRTATVALA